LTGSGNTTVTIPVGSSGNRSYTAHWSAPLTFNLGYTLTAPSGPLGTVSPANPLTYNVETATFTLTNPTHAGYTFAGWSGTDLTGTANTAVTIPQGSTGDRSYTANWGAATAYAITYTLNGGSATNPVGYDITTPTFTLTNPTRSGYTFAGWSGTGLTGTGNMTVTVALGSTGNRAYEAHWTIITYNLGYTLTTPNSESGTVSVPNPATYDVESATITLNNPTHPGYTFVGWSGTDLTGTANTTVTIAHGSVGDRSYTANWSLTAANDFTIGYTLATPHSNGDGTVSPPNPTTYNVETATFTLNSPTHPGYTFTGWTGTNGSTPAGVTITVGSTGNRNYTANWSAPVSFTIGYTLDGGTATNPTAYTIETATFTLNNPTRLGYTFAGWSGTDLTGTANLAVTIPLGSTGNRNYVAHWTAFGYALAYNLNGGTVSPANPVSYTILSPAITLNDPTRAAYDFVGWSGTGLIGTGNTPVTIAAGSTGDRSYAANWTPTAYTVIYTLTTPNGQQPPTPPVNPTGYTTESGSFTLINPAHPGYTFAGWSGTGLGGSANLTVTIPTGSSGPRAYTANWTANGYTITYNPAGGVNPPIPEAWRTYTLDNYPSNILIAPTRLGYTFDGWTGNGLSHHMAPFSINVLTPNVPGNLTYTAEWTLNSYMITYDGNGGTVNPGNPATYNITLFPVVIAVPPTHPDPRLTFIGWNSPELPGVPRQLAYNIPAGTLMNLTMRANWSQKLNDLNGGTLDSLYVCQSPRVLYGDPQAQAWTWTLPDGSQRTSRNINANESGRYICSVDYGTIVVLDTLHVYFLGDVNTRIDYITTTGAKKGKLQQFVIRLPEEISSKATAIWSVSGGGTVISVIGDTLTALWNTTGEKSISVRLALNYAGVNCTKVVVANIKITERGLGFFVNQALSSGEQDGSSWADAYRTIEEAVSTATPGDRIWVAKGTYRPDTGKGSFIFNQDSVEIYGGFAGSEEYLYERNTRNNPTIMQGDGVHPVVLVENSAGIRVDGFTIQNGRADRGAGLYFSSGSTGTLANNVIRRNTAVSEGGGVHTSAPWYGYDALHLINTEVGGNLSATGAGIYNDGSALRLLNVTVSGNKATGQAGGLYNIGNNPEILNTIIWGNVAASNADVLNAEGEPGYAYSIIGGSNGSGGNWPSALGTDGGHNRDASPLFLLNGVESDGVTLRDGNYRLSTTGAAVNAGNNAFVLQGVYTPWNILLLDPRQSLMEGLPNDLDFNARISDDDVVDIGAYEYNSELLPDVQMDREVILPAVDGVVTEPGAGLHYVPSRSDFVFTVTPSSRYANEALVVTTSRTRIADREGVTIVKSATGSYEVTIHMIQDQTEVYISFGQEIDTETGLVSLSDGSKIWSYRSELHVKTVKEAGVLRVYTLAGQLLKQQPLAIGETILPLPQGVYVVTLDESGMKRKVIIQ
jgi:uncharacterized repeat protein (TIGR02543 family)